ncbi:MAG: cob(I)yrinic acid a,c-diamide adenosyltransferase [Parcubacteria group bacterium]|nr:cob(I)yrinic acid a,c-diamide adenosyltransferase [Parcubacteria group bacterium]
MALFTGKGDGGTTKVIDSKDRFSKGSDLAEALGSLDELNSFIGLCKIKIENEGSNPIRIGKKEVSVSHMLHEVQQNLFIVQAQVAGAPKKIVKKKITQVETYINTIEAIIPPIKGFTIAGATELSALLDVARTIARRTERRVVLANETCDRKLTKDTLAYMNRLSSLLFALARLAAHQAGIKEQSPTYR